MPKVSTDNVRHSPPKSDIDRLRPTMSAKRSEAHTLTSTEALRLFEQSGLPRSQRSIERYCREEKLDCFFDVDEQRWYITPLSAERLVGQLKEIQARHEPSWAGESGPAQPNNIRPGQTPQRDAQQEKEYTEKIKELEEKVFHLEIDKRAKEYLLTQLKEQVKADRQEFISQLTQYSRRVGELETRLLQLEAPRQEARQTSGSITTREANFSERARETPEATRVYVSEAQDSGPAEPHD